MTKIGIDQSFTNTAYCLFENDVLIDFGVIKTVGKSKDGLETDYADRISRITEEIIDIINKNKVEEVSFEGLSMAKNSTTARPLGGLYFHMIIEIRKLCIPINIIPPKSVKAFAVKGTAKKIDMIAALPEDIYEKFSKKGYKKTTGLADLADAYFIGKFRRTKWN